jgi:hypothetical protein
MQLYFAGNTGVKSRELRLLRRKCDRLFSYYFVESNFFNSKTMFDIAKKKVDLFLDSGAFSAWTSGKQIDIMDYVKFIKENEEFITIYANLDVIGIGGKQPNRQTAELTWRNQLIMEKAGLKPIPCFHFGEPFEYLQRYVDRYDYLALGVAGNSGTKLIPWLDQCFSQYICGKNGMPKLKIHGFAVTSLKLMLRYPFYSVDSTSWVVTGRMGWIYIPRRKDGKWIYDQNSWKVAVSNRSPSQKESGKHITTMRPNEKKIFMDYIHEKGYSLGISEFKKVDQSYELQENERWADKKPTDKTVKREVEVIVEAGVSNSYMLRDEMNIQYFIDLERTFKKWPWPFILPNINKGFDL